jgi:hypothetical protein
MLARSSIQAKFSLFPDTERVENSENLSDSGAVVAPDSEEVEFGWEISELAALPPNILTSATVQQELFLELRKQRKRATELLERRLLPNSSRLEPFCPHTGVLRCRSYSLQALHSACVHSCSRQASLLHISLFFHARSCAA